MQGPDWFGQEVACLIQPTYLGTLGELHGSTKMDGLVTHAAALTNIALLVQHPWRP